MLQLSTSALSYDFEQAKLAGRTGWTTAALTNSLQSDLLPGFQLSVTHDLWQGQVGTDTAKFSPFLSDVQANVSLTGSTFHGLLALLGLAHQHGKPSPGAPPAPGPYAPGAALQSVTGVRTRDVRRRGRRGAAAARRLQRHHHLFAFAVSGRSG